MQELRERQRPMFLDREVTDHELLVECIALAAGQYAGWQVERVQDEPATGSMRELWLADEQHGGTEMVRLQRRDAQGVVTWHPVSSILWLPGVF